MNIVAVTPTHDARAANWPILGERIRLQGVQWDTVHSLTDSFRPRLSSMSPRMFTLTVPDNPEPAYQKINHWLDENPPCGRYVHFVMDDELMPCNFYSQLEPVPFTFCMMLRGDHSPERKHRHGCNPLFAPKAGHCGLLQVVFREDVLASERFGAGPIADGELIERVCKKWPVSYRPDLKVYFNALEPGRWDRIPE